MSISQMVLVFPSHKHNTAEKLVISFPPHQCREGQPLHVSKEFFSDLFICCKQEHDDRNQRNKKKSGENPGRWVDGSKRRRTRKMMTKGSTLKRTTEGRRGGVFEAGRKEKPKQDAQIRTLFDEQSR